MHIFPETTRCTGWGSASDVSRDHRAKKAMIAQLTCSKKDFLPSVA